MDTHDDNREITFFRHTSRAEDVCIKAWKIGQARCAPLVRLVGIRIQSSDALAFEMNVAKAV